MMIMNVMLVDDIRILREYLAYEIRKAGYDVMCAESVGEAFDMYRAERPDAIITDYVLRDGTGLDFSRQIREGDRKTPICLISGWDISEAIPWQQYCDKFLIKQNEISELLRFLEDCRR